MSNLREAAEPAVIAGSFADYRLIKSRGCLQIIIEIPVEAQAVAFDVLGYPMPGIEIPVAVARLNGIPADGGPVGASDVAPDRGINRGNFTDAALTPKARYAAMTPGEQAVQRAGMLPQDERFRAWATEQRHGDLAHLFDETEAATYIRDICCGGNSRSRIAENPEAMDRFIALETQYLIDIGQITGPR